MRNRSLAIVAIAFVACGAPHRDPGSGGDDDDGTGTDGANPNGDCADGTELVYTIDQLDNKLSQFDPATKTFHDIGPMQCQVSGGATPFSMSVARDGMAWVLYNDGELFKVSIVTLACQKTQWSSPNGLKVFGMGFSTDMPGGSAETLYVGGGQSQTQSSYTLAAINTASLTAMPIGQQPALPEMTGTGNAELWGFFPDATTPRVVQFDKTTGAIIKSFNEPTLAAQDPGYAFAQWGGDYWVFLVRSGGSTTVYQVDGMTGAIESTTAAPGRTIVGAGVSTCAPVVVL